MKELITAMASMIILMMFLLQFTTNQSTYIRMAGAEYILKQYRIEAEENCTIESFKNEALKRLLAERTGCEASEIKISISEGKSDETITTYDYSVEIPIYDVIGADKLIGVSTENNVLHYVSNGKLFIRKPEPESLDEKVENED